MWCIAGLDQGRWRQGDSISRPKQTETDMVDLPQSALTPLIQKLSKRASLAVEDVSALEQLPYEIRDVERSRYLVREGDTPGFCMAVLAGFLYRSKFTGDGARQIISVHLRGDLVCAHDHLLGEADHSIQALTRVRLACIPQVALLSAIEARPTLARALWKDSLIDASISREWLLNVGRRNARQRVAHLVCELAIRSKAAGADRQDGYTWPLTQEELGDATGLTGVHINRTVQGLRRDHLIEVDRGVVRILDWLGLREAGDFTSDYLRERCAAEMAL